MICIRHIRSFVYSNYDIIKEKAFSTRINFLQYGEYVLTEWNYGIIIRLLMIIIIKYDAREGELKMTLRECRVDKDYVVKDMDLDQAIMIRLKALGLTDGTRIHILNKKRSGSIIFHVRGTRLAVGRDIAESIHVKDNERKLDR